MGKSEARGGHVVTFAKIVRRRLGLPVLMAAGMSLGSVLTFGWTREAAQHIAFLAPMCIILIGGISVVVDWLTSRNSN